ncbi:MAG TPA: hypothetical protein VF350_03790 [Candidatus Bathyarchaeia archaeon]
MTFMNPGYIAKTASTLDTSVCCLWLCQYCGHKNDATTTVCEKCGAWKDDDIGDSGDNKDSEDLF